MGLAHKRHRHEANGAGGQMANTARVAMPVMAVGMRAIAQGRWGVIGAALGTRTTGQRMHITESHVARVGGDVLLAMGAMALVQGHAWAIE